jgi:hypothetical protein
MRDTPREDRAKAGTIIASGLADSTCRPLSRWIIGSAIDKEFSALDAREFQYPALEDKRRRSRFSS